MALRLLLVASSVLFAAPALAIDAQTLLKHQSTGDPNVLTLCDTMPGLGGGCLPFATVNKATGAVTLQGVGLALSQATSIKNLNGENISLFNLFDAFWEKRDGTRLAPITVPGPSLKVSRVEDLAAAQCVNFNDQACNAAIYGSSAQKYGSTSDMQIGGLLGTALVYSTNGQGEGVGVQGIARAVGGATAGIAGGYFEARYDSTAPRSYYYTVGVESRVNNLTGLDAVPDVVGGNNMNVYLASCGGGPTASAKKCNADYIAIAEQAQAFNGFVVAQGAVSDNGFYDASNSQNAVTVRGSHSYQFNGEGFYVLGSGDAQVITPDSSQLYLASTGAHAAYATLDDQAGGQQATISFNDAGAQKWQVVKAADNSFSLYDSAAGTTMIKAVSAGSLVLGETGKAIGLLGNLSTNGTSAVSCAAGTVSLSTVGITNGIITHC